MKRNTKSILGIIVLITLISMSCMIFQPREDTSEELSTPPESVQEESELTIEENATEPKGEVIRQWATSATASSEYGNPDWAAFQATGHPDTTDESGDFPTAWPSAERTGVDWLEVMYDMPVNPEQIDIYQNNLPNQVVEVEVLDTEETYRTVYIGQPEVTDCPYTLTIEITEAAYQITGVRIKVDQSILDPTSWDEIDAVELVGRYVVSEVADMPSADSSTTASPADEQAPRNDFELPELETSTLASESFQYNIVITS